MPWSFAEARTTVVCLIAGFLLLGFAWWNSSGTGKVSEQSTWNAVGVFALLVVVFGEVLWLVAGRRAVRARRDLLVDGMTDRLRDPVSVPSPAERGPGTVRLADETVGSDRVHRPDCLLIAGKQTTPVEAGGADLLGLRPCEVCQP